MWAGEIVSDDWGDWTTDEAHRATAWDQARHCGVLSTGGVGGAVGQVEQQRVQQVEALGLIENLHSDSRVLLQILTFSVLIRNSPVEITEIWFSDESSQIIISVNLSNILKESTRLIFRAIFRRKIFESFCRKNNLLSSGWTVGRWSEQEIKVIELHFQFLFHLGKLHHRDHVYIYLLLKGNLLKLMIVILYDIVQVNRIVIFISKVLRSVRLVILVANDVYILFLLDIIVVSKHVNWDVIL